MLPISVSLTLLQYYRILKARLSGLGLYVGEVTCYSVVGPGVTVGRPSLDLISNFHVLKTCLTRYHEVHRIQPDEVFSIPCTIEGI